MKKIACLVLLGLAACSESDKAAPKVTATTPKQVPLPGSADADLVAAVPLGSERAPISLRFQLLECAIIRESEAFCSCANLLSPDKLADFFVECIVDQLLEGISGFLLVRLPYSFNLDD